MDSGIVTGFLSIGLLMLGNLVGMAFTYGKLTQMVSDLARRVDRLDRIVNNIPKEDKT